MNNNDEFCLFCGDKIKQGKLSSCNKCQVVYDKNYKTGSLQFLEFKIKPNITLFYNVKKQLAIIYKWKEDNWNIHEYFFEDNDKIKKIFEFKIDFCEREILTQKALTYINFL